jgi:3D (Asp-Asp-Asp) domain-containing protein
MSSSEASSATEIATRTFPIRDRDVPIGSVVSIALLCVLLVSCVAPGSVLAGEKVLLVHSTAYNSVRSQTNDQPNIAAWGDVLEPGVKSVAISRDLMALGLTHGMTLTIDGLPGEFRVLDKMAKRWRKKIDIYMGEDVQAARNWGVRKVTIRWRPVRPPT